MSTSTPPARKPGADVLVTAAGEEYVRAALDIAGADPAEIADTLAAYLRAAYAELDELRTAPIGWQVARPPLAGEQSIVADHDGILHVDRADADAALAACRAAGGTDHRLFAVTSAA